MQGWTSMILSKAATEEIGSTSLRQQLYFKSSFIYCSPSFSLSSSLFTLVFPNLCTVWRVHLQHYFKNWLALEWHVLLARTGLSFTWIFHFRTFFPQRNVSYSLLSYKFDSISNLSLSLSPAETIVACLHIVAIQFRHGPSALLFKALSNRLNVQIAIWITTMASW